MYAKKQEYRYRAGMLHHAPLGSSAAIGCVSEPSLVRLAQLNWVPWIVTCSEHYLTTTFVPMSAD